MATAVAVYSNSRKGAAVANGNGHAASKSPDTRTVILRPDQAAHMLDNNSAAGLGFVTVPVSPPKDKVFECPEESLFYCQCIESMVLNRYVLCSTLLPCLPANRITSPLLLSRTNPCQRKVPNTLMLHTNQPPPPPVTHTQHTLH